jgi:hypothetical protein
LLGRAQVESGSSVDEGMRHIHAARTQLTALGAAAHSEVQEIDRWLATQGFQSPA